MTVTVTGVNDPPVAGNDSATTQKNTPVVIDVTANDTDVDGTVNPATVTVGSGPSHGSLSVNPGSGNVTYTPDAGFTGPDSFTYTVRDNDGATSNVATVTVTVNDVNDPPVANDDTATTDEGNSVTINVIANDTDADGTINPTTVAIVSGPSNGSVSVNLVSGEVTYIPDANYNGTDSFTYRVRDDDGAQSNVATVTVTVIQVGPAPSPSGLYMPFIASAPPASELMPDLVVERITVTGDGLQVTIKNQGGTSLPPYPPFPLYTCRVDVYINPNPVPTEVNQTWDQLSTQGIVWSVPTAVLLEQGDITLTIGDAYYRASLSNVPGSLPAGTQVYAQVDSYNATGSTYGAILERHEFSGGAYNNISSTVVQ